MMKEEQPKQIDAVFLAGKSARVICLISAKFLLHCSLDSITKGEREVCVSRYKDYKVNDAREFIAALAFFDIAQSPMQDVSLIVSLGRILSGFNALLLRPFFIEAFQRNDPAIVSIFTRDVERVATTYRCERNSPPLLQRIPATTSNFIWCKCLFKLLNTLEEVLKIAVRGIFTDLEMKVSMVQKTEIKTDVPGTMKRKSEEWASGIPDHYKDRFVTLVVGRDHEILLMSNVKPAGERKPAPLGPRRRKGSKVVGVFTFVVTSGLMSKELVALCKQAREWDAASR
jgi:hypothetical protein